MGYVITLSGYTPSPRSDALPWTQAAIEESAARMGPWTLIDTVTLDPVDAEPALPATRTFTTENATLPAGWYRITFLDALGGQEITDPVFAGSGVRPSVQEIANLMPDRTTVDGGGEAGTFTTGTQPTATEVDALIDTVLDAVDPRVPADAAAEVQRAARHVVALTVAILIETGRFGEQRDVNDARVGVWERLLATHEAVLDQAAHQDEAGQARFGSIPIISPTMAAASAVGVSTELLP